MTMRLTSTRAYTRPMPVPKMPSGLVELMEGLARDVLKNNPTNVYEFCAHHMEKLMEIRDGPSSNKPMTLEQKILIAQEKVRQKAKERQEKFDNEMRLQCNKSDDNINEESSMDTPVIQNESLALSVKAPVHHINDLEHSSEYEISHVPHSDKTVISDNTDTLQRDEPSTECIPGTSFEKEEPTFTEIIHLEPIIDKNVKEEELFGKIEKEEKDIDDIKESKTVEIVVQDDNIEYPLQTIKETSEDYPPSEYTSNLPEITIHHDFDETDKTEVTPVKIQLDVVNDEDKENPVQSVNEINIQQQKDSTDVTESNVLDSKIDVCESILIEDSLKCDNIELDAVNESTINKSNCESIEQLNGEKKVKTSNTNTPISISSEDNEKHVDVDNMQKQNQNMIEVTEPVNDDTNDESLNIVTDVPAKENHSNDKETIEVKDESQNSLIVNDCGKVIEKEITINEPTAEVIVGSEIKAKDDLSEEIKTDYLLQSEKLDVIKIDQTKIHLKAELEEKILDDEKSNDNSNEVLLNKTDSIENPNDDSISIVDSDLSKTDDDSAQNNHNNVDLETAAVTIQKVFRSFMFKSRHPTFDDAANDEHNSVDEDNDKVKEEYYVAAANLNKERRPLGITRMDTVLQTVNEEKSLSLSTDDSSTLSSAATTIQAHVRGFLARNRLNSSKTLSTNSLVNSHEVFETDPEQHKNKTILNIHIVPEEDNYLSRDESLITSMDLSLDGSPPSSVNLHPLSYDISERRKMLKREDAVQSVSPPSNNSGKLSEESLKEMINENGILERAPTDDKISDTEDQPNDIDNETSEVISSASTVTPTTVITLSKNEEPLKSPREYTEATLQRNGRSLTKISSDESDVITPYVPSPRSTENTTKLVHSGEFHDIVLPTKVSRNDTSVVREFKNVLVYFLLWNSS